MGKPRVSGQEELQRVRAGLEQKQGRIRYLEEEIERERTRHEHTYRKNAELVKENTELRAAMTRLSEGVAATEGDLRALATMARDHADAATMAMDATNIRQWDRIVAANAELH